MVESSVYMPRMRWVFDSSRTLEFEQTYTRPLKTRATCHAPPWLVYAAEKLVRSRERERVLSLAFASLCDLIQNFKWIKLYMLLESNWSINNWAWRPRASISLYDLSQYYTLWTSCKKNDNPTVWRIEFEGEKGASGVCINHPLHVIL